MSEKLIIFDLDGVILDSKSNMRVMEKVCENSNLRLVLMNILKKLVCHLEKFYLN